MPNSVHMMHDADARAGLARREVLADDDRVRRHDAALEQAEERRDRRRATTSPSNGRKSSSATPCSAEPRSSVRSPPMRSQIQPEASRLDDAEAEHQREHLRAARGAVAEVAAVGDDVHLRHRHRDAARDAGDAQQRLQRVPARGRSGAAASTALRRRRRGGAQRSAAARRMKQRERQHRDDAERCPCRCRSARQPTLSMKCCTIGGQTAPREIVAAGADRHRDAAAARRTRARCRRSAARTSPSSRAGRSAGRARG